MVKFKMRRIGLILLAISMISACSGTRLPVSKMDRDRSGSPVIRVGLLQQQETVDFMINGPFSVYDANEKFVARSLEGMRWQARIIADSPAKLEYRLKYATANSYDEAVKQSRALAEKNIRFELVEDKELRTQNNSAMPQNNGHARYHVVLWEIFRNWQEAETRRLQLARRVRLEVFEYVKEPPVGMIEITDGETGRSVKIPNGSRLDTERFALFDVPVGEGYHWQKNEDRVYRGLVELQIDKGGKMTVVNIIPIESYLRGVVPSEMPKEFPHEALKAQAIAARSEVFKKLARHNDEGFGICSTVHCQVYSGVNREDEKVNRAIIETIGLVLQKEDQVLDAVYNGVCGGHSENNDNVWDGLPQAHLRGVFDGSAAPDILRDYLKRETALRKWIASSAPVYCNTVTGEIPPALLYTRKYFRWRFEVPRLDLEHYIRNETGENFGSLKEILPLERGVSGRLKRIRIVGTLKTFEIVKELNIRRALSATALYSSCFLVEKTILENELPQAFIFKGAGWGHGVGMCQTGAARMALQGFSHQDILKHYYSGVELGRMY